MWWPTRQEDEAGGGGDRVQVRTDAAGATHAFAAAVRERGCSFSVGFTIDQAVQEAVLAVPAQGWTPAYKSTADPATAPGPPRSPAA